MVTAIYQQIVNLIKQRITVLFFLQHLPILGQLSYAITGSKPVRLLQHSWSS